MISQDKPNVVFVPGAWHDSNVYSLLLPSLQQAGYRSFMVNLPSVGAEPPSTSISEDITAVRSKVQEAIDDRGGSDVLVVLHSYGGAPGSSALKGLAKGEMEGKGGVVHVLYIAAYVLEEGTATGDIKGDGDTRGPSALSRYHIEVNQGASRSRRGTCKLTHLCSLTGRSYLRCPRPGCGHVLSRCRSRITS